VSTGAAPVRANTAPWYLHASDSLVLYALSGNADRHSLLELIRRADWSDVVRRSGDRMITPALHDALHRRNLLTELDPDVAAALGVVWRANAARNEALLEAHRGVAALLEEVRIPCIPLKGVALLESSLFRSTGERMLGDIDVYIAEGDVSRALARLKHAGYRQLSNVNNPTRLFERPRWQPIDLLDSRCRVLDAGHQLPALLDPSGAHVIELHYRVVDPGHPLGDWLNRRADRLISDGARGREPDGIPEDATFHLMHTFYHAELKDRANSLGVLDIRHLLDACRLIERLRDESSEWLDTAFETARTHGAGPSFECHYEKARALLCARLPPVPMPSRAGAAMLADFSRRRAAPGRIPWRKAFWRCVDVARYLTSSAWLRQLYGNLPAYRYPLALLRHAVHRLGLLCTSRRQPRSGK